MNHTEIYPGLYRHFKGNEYEVLAVGLHTETMEPMVVYRDIHSPEKVWIRPASMWSDTVIRDGIEYTRFTPIGEAGKE